MSVKAREKSARPQGAVKFPGKETVNKAAYSFVIIPSLNKTWGYDIYQDKHLFIHQPVIPGLPGNEGFKTKAAADTVARLVIGKIKKGEMPPVVTVEELKKIKAILTH